MADILILYYSRTGGTHEMARQIARGVEQVPGMSARLRGPCRRYQAFARRSRTIFPLPDLPMCVPMICVNVQGWRWAVRPVLATAAAPLKYFLDSTGGLWLAGALAGKPCGGVHLGIHPVRPESTLLSMMLPLLHHGMLLVGVPFTEAALSETRAGGTPYGPSHWSGPMSNAVLGAEEKQLCRALGRRLAELAWREPAP